MLTIDTIEEEEEEEEDVQPSAGTEGWLRSVLVISGRKKEKGLNVAVYLFLCLNSKIETFHRQHILCTCL